jgi:hypothetical protein
MISKVSKYLTIIKAIFDNKKAEEQYSIASQSMSEFIIFHSSAISKFYTLFFNVISFKPYTTINHYRYLLFTLKKLETTGPNAENPAISIHSF